MPACPGTRSTKRIARTADILQIEPLLDRKPSQLSGGQRQRVAIGRALVRDVDVFLFDEPLSNLDAKLRSELRVEIKRLHQKLANTMIYVTHDQIEAMTLADRIAVMKGGLIQQLDAPQAIYSRPVNRFVAGFIGSPGMNFFDGSAARPALRRCFRSRRYRHPARPLRLRRPGERCRGPCMLGVRPEHIALAAKPERPCPSRSEVEVEVVEPMGSDTLVWTRLGRHELRLPRRTRKAGSGSASACAIGFDPARASLFDGAERRPPLINPQHAIKNGRQT